MTLVRRYEGTVYDSNRWEGFELRPGDIIISTPPKCGTTWTQMICALLILQEAELPRPLDRLSPWIDMVTRVRDRAARAATPPERRANASAPTLGCRQHRALPGLVHSGAYTTRSAPTQRMRSNPLRG